MPNLRLLEYFITPDRGNLISRPNKLVNVFGPIAAVIILSLLTSQINRFINWTDKGLNKASNSEPAYYLVEQVIDGDTIRVNMANKSELIRLVGIDTPETNHPNKQVQCFGKAATDFLAARIDGQKVRLIADTSSTNKDRYDRLLRYVYLKDGTDVNAEIVKQGYGFAFTAFPLSRLDEFRGYESLAKAEGRGLWSECPIIDQGTHYDTGPIQ